MEPETIQALQTEFKTVAEELKLRVKEMRDLRDQLEKERTKLGEASGETKAQLDKIEQRISELQEKQTEIALKVNTPRLSGKETEEIAEDTQVKAFFKFARFAAGQGEKLTKEERTILYPEGKKYYIKGAEREPEEARALVENDTGEILVPESIDKAIIRTIADAVVIRPLAAVRTITSNREKHRRIGECSFSYGPALELGGDAAETEVVPVDWAHQYIEDGYALVWLGVNELMDSDYDLVSYIQDSVARARGEVEDLKYLKGAGHTSQEPDGLLKGTTLARVTAEAATAIGFDDLLNLMYGYKDSSSEVLKGVYRRAGVFMMHSFTELAFMKVKDLKGQYVWQSAIAAGAPNLIRGKGVYTHDDFDQIGAENDVALFGDIRSCYRILDRVGMTMQRLVEIRALAGLVGFLFKIRNTGGIIRPEACRVLQMKAEG